MCTIKKWLIDNYVKYNYKCLRQYQQLFDPIFEMFKLKNISYDERMCYLEKWYLKHYDTIYYLNGDTCSIKKARNTMQRVTQGVANILFYGTVKVCCSMCSRKLFYVYVRKQNESKWHRLNNIVYSNKPTKPKYDNLIFSRNNVDLFQKSKEQYNLFVK